MKLVVIGLGYVGLPLAVALARKFDVVGFDIDRERIEQLQAGFDRTREVEPGDLADSKLTITGRPEDCRDAETAQ